jgi:hypothetical protein
MHGAILPLSHTPSLRGDQLTLFAFYIYLQQGLEVWNFFGFSEV